MGWTVLYIAFGIVALWLLGEVLLQYKARLRWRLLAFVGFLGVVLGVLMPSVVVIAIGAAAFAVGQTYVTLSFRRGFSTGWALVGKPGASKRRRGEPRGGHQDPTLEVSDLEYEPGDPDTAPEPPAPLYEPEPLPDDTGQYGVYSDSAYATTGDSAYAPTGDSAYATTGDSAYAPTGDSAYAPTGDSAYATTAAPQNSGYGYDTYAGYDQQQYGHDTGQQQYAAAYSDPYIGTQTYTGQQPYDTHGGQQPYGQAGSAQDPYATASYGGSETPPGGVWVPQQRMDDHYQYGGELPPEQPYPYHDGQAQGQPEYDSGYNDQQPYRY